MKSYILSLNTSQIERKKVTELLDTIPEVVNWYGFFPGTVALVSTVDATKLGELIRNRQTDEFQFVIIEKADDSNGWLPRDVWDFLNKPKKA
jgi:hypothetical protein